MDRLQAATVFLRVVELGSFSAAARDLRLGQPAVSRIVAALERDLGVQLLVRSTRALRLTDAGVAFHRHALQSLTAVDEAWAAARGAAARLDGRLCISAPVTFARLHVVPALGDFLAAHPALTLDLVLDDRPINLVEAGIDVALRLGAPNDPAVQATRLATSERLLVASPAYLARHGAPATPEALASHAVVVYRQATGGDEWHFRTDREERRVRVQSRLTVTAAEGVREAVLAGYGLAVTSRWMMAPELASGAVVPVLEAWRLPPMDLWMLVPGGARPSAKARAFAAWCTARFGGARNGAPAGS